MGTIRLTVWLQYFEDSYMKYSQIYLLQKEPGAEKTMDRLTLEGIPSAYPSMYRDQSDRLHVMWKDRRQDPEFEHYEGRHCRFRFSTDITYSQYGKPDTCRQPLVSGTLGSFGRGNLGISSPSLAEDSQQQLHAVFRSSGNITFDGTVLEAGGWRQIGYLKWRADGSWELAGYPLISGHTPVIATSANDELVVAYLGNAPNLPSGNNNVIVIRSVDGGKTWSEASAVFLTGMQPAMELRIARGPDGWLHLVWKRAENGNVLFTKEMWHSSSSDGGWTWSKPERFMRLEPSPLYSTKFFQYFDIIADSYGRLHWAAMVNKWYSDGAHWRLRYMSWDPVYETWSPPEALNPESQSGGPTFALDENSDELYVFWSGEEMASGQYGIYYSKKEIVELPYPYVRPESIVTVYANYPNPFNPSTVIPFTLLQGGDVVLNVYDLLGRTVVSRDLGSLPAGHHQRNVELSGQGSGTYIYEITLDGLHRNQRTMAYVQ